jgi:hypothetical protein
VDVAAAQTWFIAGAIIIILAGGGHAILSLLDTLRPRWFTPIDDSVRSDMEGTGMRFRRPFPGDEATPSIWTFWLGFNVSHGLGAFTFGLLCLLIAIDDFELVKQIDGLWPLTVAIAAAYFAIALRYWFNAVRVLTGAATVCFAMAAVLSA